MRRLCGFIGYLLLALSVGILLAYLLPAWILVILLAAILAGIGFLVVKKR